MVEFDQRADCTISGSPKRAFSRAAAFCAFIIARCAKVAKGVSVGRPRLLLTDDFDLVLDLVINVAIRHGYLLALPSGD